MNLKIKLRANFTKTKQPSVKISVNDLILCDEVITQVEKEYFFKFEPKENNILSIEHYNKENSATVVDQNGNIVEDLSIELISIEFDDIKILETVLYNMPFCIKWPDNLVEDYKSKSETPPEYITNNLYFGFNGTYKFDFSNNIVVEYYKQFWIDETQAHQNQTLSDNGREIFKRMGETVEINKDSDFTIHDLKRMVMNNES